MSAGNRRGRRRGGKQRARYLLARDYTDEQEKLHGRSVPTPAAVKLAGVGMVRAGIERTAPASVADATRREAIRTSPRATTFDDVAREPIDVRHARSGPSVQVNRSHVPAGVDHPPATRDELHAAEFRYIVATCGYVGLILALKHSRH
jgi:hypothetical protein